MIDLRRKNEWLRVHRLPTSPPLPTPLHLAPVAPMSADDSEQRPLADSSESEQPRDCCSGCRAVLRFLSGFASICDLAFSAWYLDRAVEACQHNDIHGWAVVLGILNISLLLFHLILAGIFHPFAFGLNHSLIFIFKCFNRICCPSLTVSECWTKIDASTAARKTPPKGCCDAIGDVSEDLDKRLEKPVEASLALLGGALLTSLRAAVALNLLIRFYVFNVAVVVASVVVLLQYLHFVFMQICYCGAMRNLGMSGCGAFCLGCVFGTLIIYVFPAVMSYLLWKYDDTGEELCMPPEE